MLSPFPLFIGCINICNNNTTSLVSIDTVIKNINDDSISILHFKPYTYDILTIGTVKGRILILRIHNIKKFPWIPNIEILYDSKYILSNLSTLPNTPIHLLQFTYKFQKNTILAIIQNDILYL